MSKIGKKPIEIPSGVTVKVAGSWLNVSGPKGELKKEFLSDKINVLVENNLVVLSPNYESGEKEKALSRLWGLYRSLLAGMIKGVSEGFEESLEFEGVGYKANVKGDNLELNLGYSHPIIIDAPAGISFKTDKGSIKIFGIDKELVGQVAAEIRNNRRPEPYKGSGIRYAGEIIKKKAGKKAVATS